MKYFNLYKMGRYGWFHVTSFHCENLKGAFKSFEKFGGGTIGKDLGNYKITGL